MSRDYDEIAFTPAVSEVQQRYGSRSSYGHARVASAEDEPELVGRLVVPDYEAVVQRAVLVSVQAFDWNCQQHITPRYTAAELEPVLATMRRRISDLEAENQHLTAW